MSVGSSKDIQVKKQINNKQQLQNKVLLNKWFLGWNDDQLKYVAEHLSLWSYNLNEHLRANSKNIL